MERFEVGPAVQIGSGNLHEIDILGQDTCERVTIAFSPCIAEILRKFGHRLPICFGLTSDGSLPLYFESRAIILRDL